MTYKVETVVLEDQTAVFFVHEDSTDQYVHWSLDKNNALEYRRFLEQGGAFAGWTPAFILIETAPPTDVNEAFEAELEKL